MNKPAWMLWRETRLSASEILARLALVPPRDELGLYPASYTRPAVDIQQILEAAGVQVVVDATLADPVAVQPPQIRIRPNHPCPEERFLLAYGLGLLIRQGPAEARSFAGALLMPASVVEWFSGQFLFPEELAPLFQVPPRVMRARMQILGFF